ncbi:MAG: TssQ family T6SS-associated lipoprotein [Sulfuricella sp.]|jgi:Tfp pilus assembly protein PilF
MLKFNLSLFSLLALLLFVSGCSNTSLKKLPFIQDEAPVQKKAEDPADKPSPPAVRKAERELSLGIRNYENGNYNMAAGFFQNALGDDQLSVGDQVTAHKFLAFIYCVSGEKLACRGAFKKVLALNPKFGLSASEAGHPTWGPVFREVQAEVAARKTR